MEKLRFREELSEIKTNLRNRVSPPCLFACLLVSEPSTGESCASKSLFALTQSLHKRRRRIPFMMAWPTQQPSPQYPFAHHPYHIVQQQQVSINGMPTPLQSAPAHNPPHLIHQHIGVPHHYAPPQTGPFQHRVRKQLSCSCADFLHAPAGYCLTNTTIWFQQIEYPTHQHQQVNNYNHYGPPYPHHPGMLPCQVLQPLPQLQQPTHLIHALPNQMPGRWWGDVLPYSGFQ
jgi:hypothetical protein